MLLRVWGVPRVMWTAIAGFSAFFEWAGNFATGGRVMGFSDIVFIIGFAVVGVVALLNAIRPASRAV